MGRYTLMPDERVFRCEDCGHERDRDLNAALNLLRLDTFPPDVKRMQEPRQTVGLPAAAFFPRNAMA